MGRPKHKASRTLTRYRIEYGVLPPYQVLVFPEFFLECRAAGVPLAQQLPSVFKGSAAPCVTPCVMARLRSFGRETLDAVWEASKWRVVECGHAEAVSPLRCVCEVLRGGPPGAWCAAASWRSTEWEAVKTVPGVPLVSLTDVGQRVLVLEPMSEDTLGDVRAKSERKMQVRRAEPEGWLKPRKRPAAPNPLSVKKKKKKPQQQQQQRHEPPKKKRKRKRKRKKKEEAPQ